MLSSDKVSTFDGHDDDTKNQELTTVDIASHIRMNEITPSSDKASFVDGDDDSKSDINANKEAKIVKLSSRSKWILVCAYVGILLNKDIVKLIYYFYDTNLQRSHLSPYYYRVVFISRPFGISLCKKLNEEYLCLVMPNSPNGQIGLRAGSQLLAYNGYVVSNDYSPILKEQFNVSGFKVKTQITDYLMHGNDVLPLTMYLKYDPIHLLHEIEKCYIAKPLDRCEFLDTLNDDVYRWAIEGRVEQWKVVNPNGLEIYTIPPIQSPIIQNNILRRVLQHKDISSLEWSSVFNECVKIDDFYYKIGHLNCKETVKIYGKAGAYFNIMLPIKGWIQCKNPKKGTFNVSKLKVNSNANSSANDEKSQKNCTIQSKSCRYHFQSNILKKYRDQSGLTQYLNDLYVSGNWYDILDVLSAVDRKHDCNCSKIIFFMDMLHFGKNSLDLQMEYLSKLIYIAHNSNDKVELLIMTVHNNLSSDYTVNIPVMYQGYELSGYLIGRVNRTILDEYDVANQYDAMNFFKFGILFLDHTNQIYIKPNEVVDDATFEKIKFLVQRVKS